MQRMATSLHPNVSCLHFEAFVFVGLIFIITLNTMTVFSIDNDAKA